MANRNQSQFNGKSASQKQAISQHPLFPAIVALWFGAAFGLASLAIRPSFIEHAVVAAGIDKVIPMAAPPLGTTTRILISLGMCALGGVLGSLVGHRIARPAAEPTVRRRRAASSEGAAPRETAAEGPRTERQPEARTARGTRRRALALNEGEGALAAAPDHAPLPGQPGRILQVAEFDLDGFEDVAAQAADVVVEAGMPAPVVAEPSIIAAPAVPHEEPAVAAAAFVPAPQAHAAEISVGRDRDEEEDGNALPAFAAPEAFAAPAVQPVSPATAPAPAAAAAAADTAPTLRVLENRLFQTYSREIKARADEGARTRSAPLFGAPAPVVTPGFDLLPRLGLGEWGDDGSEREAEDRIDGYAPDQAPQPLFTAPVTVSQEPDLPAGPVAAAEPGTAPAAVEADQPDDDADANHEPGHSAAERIAHAELDALSHLELLERLALAMEQQRRVAASAAIAPETMPEPAIEATVGTALEPATSVAAQPEPLEDVAAGLPDAPEVVAEAAPESEVALAGEPEEVAPLTEVALDAGTPAPFAAPALPSSMRPVGFDEDEDEALPGYHPPRHIQRPQQIIEAPFERPAAEHADDDAQDAQDLNAADEDVLEAGYSSLLDLSRPAADKPRFVRIEEPESVAIEPVVIFPGEAARTPAPFAQPGATWAQSTMPDPATTPIAAQVDAVQRAFDPPGAAPRAGGPATTPAETEKALRAALATLQRMSGAA